MSRADLERSIPGIQTHFLDASEIRVRPKRKRDNMQDSGALFIPMEEYIWALEMDLMKKFVTVLILLK